MKILKIQLQNINSLTSDRPIIIDFEADAFRDIGLFAITGPTGAGKTTILDAIMIALYHKIPRIKISGVGALEMAISHGAPNAFVTLDFENNDIRYQAHWDVQTQSKTGKSINPKHNFSIKNLTAEEIIASGKKTAVFEAIEEIITLTADQFLRSVLLAQGEFAAFLNANGSDKAKLLEQITGEEIYNQIGHKTLERKGKEDKVLEKITGKINLDDLITPEELVQLKTEQASLESENKGSEAARGKLEKASNWYKIDKEISAKRSQLEITESDFLSKVENAQGDLKELQASDEAEPFRVSLTNAEEVQERINELSRFISDTEHELNNIEIQLNTQQGIISEATKEKETSQQAFEKWQPILQELIDIEKELSTSDSNKIEKEKQLKDCVSKSIELEILSKTKTIEHSTLMDELNKINTFFEENKSIPLVEKRYPDWRVQLLKLKDSKHEIVTKNSGFDSQKVDVNEKKELQESLKAVYLLTEENLKKEQEQINELIDQLTENDIEQIIQEKETNQIEINNWQETLNQAKEYKALTETINTDKTGKSKLSDKKISAEKYQVLLNEKQITREELYGKAVVIFDQQKLIQKYEADRLLLKKDEPCSLCGSTAHPFIDAYNMPKLSQAEADFLLKREQLEEAKSELQLSRQETAVLENKLHNIEEELEKNVFKQKKLIDAVEQKNTICGIESFDEIVKQLEKHIEIDQDLSQKTKKNSLLQKEKIALEKSFDGLITKEQKQKEELTILSTNLKSAEKESSKSKEELSLLKQNIEADETVVASELREFNMKVPTPERTNEILDRIEHHIANYKNKKEEQIRFEGQTNQLQTEIDSLAKQLEDLKKQTTELNKVLAEFLKKYQDLINKRVVLLPLKTSVSEQRTKLQTQKDNTITQLSEIEKEGQDLINQQIAYITKQKTYQTDLGKQNTKLTLVQKSLSELLINSGFETLDFVRTALLSVTKKSELTAIKEQLDSKEIELKTLDKQFKQDFEQLEQQKDFEETVEEVTSLQNELIGKTDKNNHRLGELTQQFNSDEKLREDNKDLVAKKDKQQIIVDKWATLYRLLGGSKDAFNTYVQRITLKNLLLLANIHLFKLNKRYELQMSPTIETNKELDFLMIDRYHNDQTRAIDTASGGEKFLISLALALGLADLTSRNMTIDSLFIDEGFGTLDQQALESAMHTLETLQSEGKLIGIISHVENLKERIPTQIQVSKKSNGVSQVKVVSGD